MTTKELLSRLESFSTLDVAAQFILVGTCYRVTYSLVPHTFHITYVGSLDFDFIPDFNKDSVSYCSFELFSPYQFKTQLGYFKSFFARCSERQKAYIRSSCRVARLLAFCDCPPSGF